MMTGWPVEQGLGALVEEVVPGGVTLRLDLRHDLLDQRGQPGMAVLACLADCVIGVSVFTSVEAPTGGSTLEMRIDRAAPLGRTATSLRITGSLGHANRSGGLGRAVFSDDTGVTVAHGMATMASSGGPPDSSGPDTTDPGNARTNLASTSPKPASTSPASTSPASANPGRKGAAAGTPLFDAFRLEHDPAWDGPDPATATLPILASFVNPQAQVHGGVLMTIAERAQRRLHPPGSESLTVTIEYFRPVPITADHILCRSRKVRSGRRYSTVRTELVRPDGKVAAEATGIAAVVG